MLTPIEHRFQKMCLDSLKKSYPTEELFSINQFLQEKNNPTKSEKSLNQIAEKIISQKIFNNVPKELKYRIQNHVLYSHQDLLIKLILFKALENNDGNLIKIAHQIQKPAPKRFEGVKSFFQIKMTKVIATTLNSKIFKVAFSIFIAVAVFALIYVTHAAILSSVKNLISKFIIPLGVNYLPAVLFSLVKKVAQIAQFIFTNFMVSLALFIGWHYLATHHINKTEVGKKLINIVNFILYSINSLVFSFFCTSKLYSKKESLDHLIDKTALYFENIHNKYLNEKKKLEMTHIEQVWMSIFNKKNQQKKSPAAA